MKQLLKVTELVTTFGAIIRIGDLFETERGEQMELLAWSGHYAKCRRDSHIICDTLQNLGLRILETEVLVDTDDEEEEE